MSSMLVHDMRLHGRTPKKMAKNRWEVSDKVAVQHIIDWIHAYARSQVRDVDPGGSCSDAMMARGEEDVNSLRPPHGLDNLIIMCHGYESYDDLTDQATTTAETGGWGLQLGTEGVDRTNVDLMGKLYGDITKITIFACGVAGVGAGNRNTQADGMAFCGEIALVTGATVVAPVETQYYTYAPSLWDWIRGQDGEIDFGNWEGPLFSFSPDDGSATQIQ